MLLGKTRCAGSTRSSVGLRIKCRLDTSINIACGQPLLVAVVSALVGDAGDAQEPGVAGPLEELSRSGRKDLGEREQERGSRVPPGREPAPRARRSPTMSPNASPTASPRPASPYREPDT